MNLWRRSRFLSLLLLVPLYAFPASQPTINSVRLQGDSALNTNPDSRLWRKAQPIYMESDPQGKPEPAYRTEVRTRWTNRNLYFLFICPYQKLNLKPHPQTSSETNELWNWDVAEVFIGSDFRDIKQYKEFEISPRGEWIDLDIDLHKPHHEDGWTWNSGFQVAARIDPIAHIWYGAMKIPYSAIDARPAAAGNFLRINLFRTQGPEPERRQITWQPPKTNTFHVPERFGLLRLVNNN